MIFKETKLTGAYVIELEKIRDKRGFFARTWDRMEFTKYNLSSKLVQCSISYNKKKGTLRGMHYQITPYEEIKLVRCTKGSIFDVIIDLRPQSTTFQNWIGVKLSDVNYKMLYVPKGFAHGFQTLEDDTEVFYQMSQNHMSDYSQGVRWNDPAIKIKWPLRPSIIAERDKKYPDYH